MGFLGRISNITPAETAVSNWGHVASGVRTLLLPPPPIGQNRPRGRELIGVLTFTGIGCMYALPSLYAGMSQDSLGSFMDP